MSKNVLQVSESHCHVAMVGEGVHAVFQSALPKELSYLGGSQWYSYARITADRRAQNALRLVRSDDGQLLIPAGQGPFDEQFRQHMLVMPADRVDAYIASLGTFASRDSFISGVPAERLYQAVRRMELAVAGAAIEACATYDFAGTEPRLVMVNAEGGYGLGTPPREGLVSESALASLAVGSLVRSEQTLV